MIHHQLQRRGCLPEEHEVDGGYVSGHTLVESQADYGVDLLGPVAANTTWQAKEGGVVAEMFTFDWARQQARCPEGHVSVYWLEQQNEYGQPVVEIRFPAACCQACGSCSGCTRSPGGRSLKVSRYLPALVAARQRQETPALRREYAQRAGIEGTISDAVRGHGARESR